MDTKEEIYYYTTHNCIHLTINAILKKKLGNTRLFWNQSACLSYKNNEEFHFTPYFKDFKKQLITDFKISSNLFETQNLDSLFDKMDFILCNNSLILPIDLFYLDHAFYKGKLHHKHYFEVSKKVNENEYYICDHYYKYSGLVNKKDIAKMLKSLIENKLIENYFLLTFDTSNYSEERLENYFYNTIKLNNSIFEKKEDYIELNENDKFERLLGIDAFDSLKDYILKEVFEIRGNIDISFDSIKEMGNSRYNYMCFIEECRKKLKLNNEINEELILMGKLLKNISQKCRLAANLIIKTIVSKKFDEMESKIIEILDDIRCKEIELSSVSVSLLYKR